ncbi:hypothetical protein, partial [Blastococcus sp. KM273129]|uniref:hypothetical protein n=1 Tax=Blastococcus sp. KM273129 TaxID=2570315 RepID=UPI001F1D037C
AHVARPAVGATGTATWRLSKSIQAVGWMRALRPGASSGGEDPTEPVSDTTAPSVPGGVAAVADGPAQVTVSWSASTDDV